jgi:hypothetical protein
MASLIAHSEIVDVVGQVELGSLDVYQQESPILIAGQACHFAILTLQGKVELEMTAEVSKHKSLSLTRTHKNACNNSNSKTKCQFAILNVFELITVNSESACAKRTSRVVATHTNM